MAACLNIQIRFLELPEHVNGYWRKILRQKFICLSSKLNNWQAKVVLCHEMGHIILHPDYHYYCMSGRTFYCSQAHEDEANAFALEMCRQFTDYDLEIVEKFLKDGWK